MTYSLSVDKRQTLTHPNCGHPPEELLLFFKCCAIETTINCRHDGLFDVPQLFLMECFIALMNAEKEKFSQRRARRTRATVESGREMGVVAD
jgi:hypothetical protein